MERTEHKEHFTDTANQIDGQTSAGDAPDHVSVHSKQFESISDRRCTASWDRSPATDLINGLFAFRSMDIRVRLGKDIIVEPDPQFISANAASLLLYPVTTDGEAAFAWGVMENVGRDAWQNWSVKPTAVLHQDDTLIVCFRFWIPSLPEYAHIAAVVAGLEGIGEPVPLPSVGGWELIHRDDEAATTIYDLESAHLGNTVKGV